MKKGLKFLSLLLILVTISFGGLNEAKAEIPRTELGITATGYKVLNGATIRNKSSKPNQKLSDIGVSLKTPKDTVYPTYYIHTMNGKALYCLDAPLSSFNELYAGRFLFTDQYTLDDVKPGGWNDAGDYALTYILKNGPSGTDLKSYFVTSLAVRSMSAIFGYLQRADVADGDKLSGNYVRYQEKAYYGQAYKWITGDASIKASFDTIAKVINKSNFNNGSSGAGYEWQGSPVDEAKSLFAAALAATAEYIQNAGTSGDIKDVKAVPGSDADIKEEIVAEGTKVSRLVTHTATLKGFKKTEDKTPEFVISEIAYDGGAAAYGASSEPIIVSIKIGDNVLCEDENGDACKSFIGKNLLESIELTDEMQLTIVVKMEGYKTVNAGYNLPVLKCGKQPMEYTIKYNYKTIGESNNDLKDQLVVVWRSTGNDNSGDYQGKNDRQRFLNLEGIREIDEDEDSKEGEFKSGKIHLIDDCSCEDLKNACIATGNLNSDECQEFKEADCGECSWLETVCEINPSDPQCNDDKLLEICDATCDTTFSSFFACCDDSDDHLLISQSDDKEVEIKGPTENYACFVSKVDAQCQGDDPNSADCTEVPGVKDQKDNPYTSIEQFENKYCTVSCKEDYAMTMPTAKLVNAGRYFTFKAKVDGTKVCFTNTIQRDQYHKDILAAQEALIAAYNNFKDWEKASQTNSQNDIQSYVSGNSPAFSGCGCNPQSSTGIFGAYTDDYIYDYYYIDQIIESTGRVIGHMGTHDGKKSVASVVHTESGGSYYDSWECPVPGTDRTTTCTCEGDCEYEVIDEVKDTGDLKELIDNNLAAARAALAGAQEHYRSVIAEFNACSAWSSEIKYAPNVYYDYDEDYLDKYYGGKGSMDETLSNNSNVQWYCNSTVTSVTGVEQKAEISDKTGENSYSQCTLSTSGATKNTTIHYSFCDEDKCYIGQGESVQQISDARYKKITSNITADYVPSTLFYNVYPSGEIEATQSERNVAIEHGLPVALNTARGIYKYTVNIEKLGEFYRSGDGSLGRYVTSSSAVVDPQKLVYDCSYLVNIIVDDKTFVCDDHCSGDNCVADCIGPNCADDPGYCDGINCVAECIGLGCIYDTDAGSSLLERTISLNNMFPNGTTAYNWTNVKGDFTRQVIERDRATDSSGNSVEGDNGNSIYDTTPIFSVTIDPSTARQLKEYNDGEEGNGGYSNATLDCYALGGYQEIACYSSVISDILRGTYGSDATNDSLITDSGYRTVTDDNTQYFELWTGAISVEEMLGPSWK